MSTIEISAAGSSRFLYGPLTGDPALLISGDDIKVTLLNAEVAGATGPAVRLAGARTLLVVDTGSSVAGGGATAIEGSAFTDYLVNRAGTIAGDIRLGGGDDSFQNNFAAAVGNVYGGDGNDYLGTYQGSVSLHYFGEAGDDGLSGGSAGDELDGGSGADRLYAYAGADRLTGGSGADLLAGGLGNDRISGGGDEGDFALFSGNWADFSYTIIGGAGSVTDRNAADGDEGTDTIDGVHLLRFADQLVDTRLVRNELLLTEPGQVFTNGVDRYGYAAADLRGEGSTFINQAEIRGNAVLFNGRTAALAINASAIIVQNRAGAAIVSLHDAIASTLPGRPGNDFRLFNDGLIQSLEQSAVYIDSTIEVTNGATGVIDGSRTAIGAPNSNATVFNEGVIRGGRYAVTTNMLILHNEGSISGEIRLGQYSRIENSGSIEGRYDCWGGLTLINRGDSEGDLAINAQPVAPHHNGSYTIAEIENHDTFTGDILITDQTQFREAPSATALYLTTILNTGRLTGSIVSDATVAPLVGETVAKGFFVEQVVNRGTIDGDVRLGDGDDRLDNSGTITGIVDGGAGNDVLTGGAKAGIELHGGAGDDLFNVAAADTVVQEAEGGGSDRVNAAVDWVLTPGSAVELLVAAGGAAIDLTGNGLANEIRGNAADNVLDGGGGKDLLIGYGGNDTYVVDNPYDRVKEASGGGADRVNAAVTYTLAAGEHVETLATTNRHGTAAIDLTGNERDNSLYGNAAVNSLRGGAGADLIDGGAGADTMRGNAGDDRYIVDSSRDIVIELAGEGIDTVTSFADFVLPGEVENLVLGGGANLAATGNGLANAVTGNGGNNRIDGGGGADTLAGGQGHDVYVVGHALDQVVEQGSSGTDTIEAAVSYRLPVHVEKLILTGSLGYDGRGNSGANTLTGNAGGNFLSGGSGDDLIRGGGGNDRLLGGPGDDVLTGGSGLDRFEFTTAPGADNVDAILDFSAASDNIHLLRSAFTRAGANGTLSAAAFHEGSAAADAGDRIVYDAAAGRILYDADGTGAAAAILFATVAPGTALSHADFIIYG